MMPNDNVNVGRRSYEALWRGFMKAAEFREKAVKCGKEIMTT